MISIYQNFNRKVLWIGSGPPPAQNPYVPRIISIISSIIDVIIVMIMIMIIIMMIISEPPPTQTDYFLFVHLIQTYVAQCFSCLVCSPLSGSLFLFSLSSFLPPESEREEVRERQRDRARQRSINEKERDRTPRSEINKNIAHVIRKRHAFELL